VPDVSPSLNAGDSRVKFIRARTPVCAFEVLVASARSVGSHSKQGDPRDALLSRPTSDVPGVPRGFGRLAWIVGIFRLNSDVRISGSNGAALGVAVASRFNLRTASETTTFSSMNYSSLR
jgi:hypothetical protein